MQLDPIAFIELARNYENLIKENRYKKAYLERLAVELDAMYFKETNENRLGVLMALKTYLAGCLEVIELKKD